MIERNFKIITAPTSEPVTASDVKLYTRVLGSAEDTLINTWIKEAREIAEGYQHRAYITQTIELTYDCFPDDDIITLPRCPLVSVNSIKYYDSDNNETTYSSDNYQVDTASTPGRIALNYGVLWPSVTLRSMNGVVINYTAGFGDASAVPSAVKDAIYLYCAYKYENRIAEDGTIPQAFWDILTPDRIEDR